MMAAVTTAAAIDIQGFSRQQHQATPETENHRVGGALGEFSGEFGVWKAGRKRKLESVQV